MSFLSALDTTQYNALRGNGVPRSYKASQFMVMCSNTTVFAGRVNQATFTNSFAQITFDTVTTGAYTDIGVGMTVLISRTNDRRAAYFEGRVRKTATSTILYVNETSSAIADNDYIFVIRDYRPFYELGRVSGGVYYKDYDLTFSQLKPIISGLQSAYAGIVSGSPAGYTVTFTATATAATSGATISTYAWTIPTGGTVTAGSISAASVTVRFDASSTEYWVKLVVTDSGSRTQTRWIPVWAVPADLSTTVVRGFTGAHIEGSIDNGWSATVDAFAGVENTLNGTLCCFFSLEYYQDTAYNLFSNIDFVGRFRKEANANAADPDYSNKRKVSFEIEGTAAQLARLSTPLITARDASSPTVWDEIKTLTIWRAITYVLEHSTFHELFSLSFDSTANTYRAFQLQSNGQNQFEAVKDLASAINAVLEFAPSGEARVVRDARYLSSTARDALTTVANFHASDWINIASLEIDYPDVVGIVEASGGAYNPTGGGITANAVQAMLSIAPGVAQGNGTDTKPLTGQILTADVARATAQAELNTRAANHFALSNGSPTLAMDMRGAYHWLIPSVAQWYTWTIATTDNRRGLAYTTANRWLLRSLTIEHDNVRGNKQVNAVWELESSATDSGVAGQTVVIPPTNSVSVVIPEIPSFPGYPNFPPDLGVYLPSDPTQNDLPPLDLNPIPLNGNSVVTWSTDHIWVTRNFITTPKWVDITPSDIVGTIRDFASILYGGYLISSDGADSAFHYCENLFTASPAWVTTSLTGEVYQAVRAASTLGTVYIYSPDSLGGITDITALSTVYNSGNGQDTGLDFTTSDSVTITASGSWGYWGTPPTAGPDGAGFTNPAAVLPSADIGSLLYRIGTSGAWTLAGSSVTFTPSSNGRLYLIANDLDGQSAYDDNYGSLAVTVNNYVAGNAKTVYSTDYGASFASARTAGVSPGTFGGVDTIRIGVPILVGSDGQVYIATSAGGTYSAYGGTTPTGTQPNAIIIPRYQFGSTSSGNVTTSTPQYLMASNVLGSSNKALLKVTSSGATFTDITPSVSGDYGLAVSAGSIAMPWWSGARMAAVLMFGSLPRLVVSTNSGAAWTDRGVLDTSAKMVKYRKGDRAMKQLFLAAGQPAYSPDHGAHIYLKSYPADYTSEPVIGIEVFG